MMFKLSSVEETERLSSTRYFLENVHSTDPPSSSSNSDSNDYSNDPSFVLFYDDVSDSEMCNILENIDLKLSAFEDVSLFCLQH